MRQTLMLSLSPDHLACATGGADIDRHIISGPRLIAGLAVFALLAGCSGLPQILEPAPVTEPDAPSDTPAVALPAPPEPQSAPQPEPRPERSRVAILLSDDIATYTAIAKQISQQISGNDYITLNLDGSPTVASSILPEIKEFEPDKIVAIGLLAARTGQKFTDTPMVFCQVFNYPDHHLISPTSKGVQFLPPFSLQLEVWKALTPDLQKVGVILGPNQEDLLAEIEQAAELHGVKLLARTVESDKEALYAFKRLTPQIQGFWLLPDNRVLSPRVLREIFAYGRKHGNQTVVFSPQLLSLGADISFASSDADIANAVLRVLGDATDKDSLAGPPMTSLTTLRAEIRPEIADRLRPQSSAKLAQYMDTE